VADRRRINLDLVGALLCIALAIATVLFCPV
jgi:hypothetical protein